MYNLDYVFPKNIEITKNASKKEYFSNKQLLLNEFENAYVLPIYKGCGGIVTCDDIFLDYSFVHRGCGKAYNFDKNNVKYDDSIVVYIGMLNPIWGHCITDNLKHLWFLLDKKYDYLKKYKFIYISTSENKLPDNYIYILKKLGLDIQNMFQCNEIRKYKKIIVPEDCFYLDIENEQRKYTKEYKKIIETIEKDIKPNTEKKIYFSRSKLKNKFKDFGEKKVEKVFEQKGYKIFYPEKLSIEQQISLLKGCDYFATTDGSTSHNALFLNEKSNLIILRKANYQNGYQSLINNFKEISVFYIDCHKSVCVSNKSPYSGPFFIYKNHNLNKYFNNKDSTFPLFSFLLYVFIHIIRKVLILTKTLLRKVLHK